MSTSPTSWERSTAIVRASAALGVPGAYAGANPGIPSVTFRDTVRFVAARDDVLPGGNAEQPIPAEIVAGPHRDAVDRHELAPAVGEA